MKKSSLREVFDIKESKSIVKDILKTDYETFSDKKLLDSLRTKIIEDLIDNEMPEGMEYSEWIDFEIDKSIEDYDLSNSERSYLFNLIDNEINGFGPISELLNSPNITEIMINSPKEIYIEIDGTIVKEESISFINDEHIVRTVQRLIQPLGRTIDAANPMVDSRLKDGSRINAIIPPLSVKGPIITIRKFKSSLEKIK